MTPEERTYIRYRLSRARESLEEARLLLQAEHLPTAVSRLYYACFYAVSALLLTQGQTPAKHSGVRALFDKEWVKSGREPRELGRFYRDMFDRRQTGDYVDLVNFDSAEVTVWLDQSSGFVARISQLAEEQFADHDEQS